MATNEQDTCPACLEYGMPQEWLALRAENARLREALQLIVNNHPSAGRPMSEAQLDWARAALSEAS